jgi:hypothetical protein
MSPGNAALQAAVSGFVDVLSRLTGALTTAATPLIANSLNTSLATLQGSLSSAVSPDPAGGADKPEIEPRQTADFTTESGRLTVAGGPAPAVKNRRTTA